MASAVKKSTGFSDQERAAMKERALELKAQEKAGRDRAAGEKMLLEKLAEMPEPDQSIGKKIHEIVNKNAPQLLPKTWYGMPAYANKEGKVVCFFQGAAKFESRYASLGFNDAAKLDDGNMWATSFAILKLTKEEEAKIVELIKKIVL